MFLRRSHHAPPIPEIARIFLAARRFHFGRCDPLQGKLPSAFFGYILLLGFKKRFKKSRSSLRSRLSRFQTAGEKEESLCAGNLTD